MKKAIIFWVLLIMGIAFTPSAELNPLIPTTWDSDGDGLPDQFEINHMSGHPPGKNLDPLNALDGAADFDEDGNTNTHEFWNGSNLWSVDPVPNAGYPQTIGCYYWGKGDNNPYVGPGDLLQLRLALAGIADYSRVLPGSGDAQDMDRDGYRAAEDLPHLRSMLAGMDLTEGLPSTAAGLSVVDAPSGEVAVGSTTHVTVSVRSQGGLVPYASGFGVMFYVESGNATLLGGEGALSSGPRGNRYDISMEASEGALAKIVVRIDGPGPITVGVKIPGCGFHPPYGRWSQEIELASPILVNTPSYILVSAADWMGANFLYHGRLLFSGFDPAGLTATDLGSDPMLDPVLPGRKNMTAAPCVVLRQGWSAVGLGQIACLDPSDFSVDRTFDVNDGTNPANPQDMLILAPDKAYVTRFEPPYNDILIVNPQTGNPFGRIDLTGEGTNPDGLPRLTKMLRVGSQVFVLMQNFSLFWPFTYGNGRIAVIDSAADSLITIIDLKTINPLNFTFWPDQNRLLVASAGNWTDPSLSGLESVNVITLDSDTVLVRGNHPGIQGFLTDVVWLGGNRAVLLSSRADWSGNDLLPFDLKLRVPSASVYSSGFISDIDRDLFHRLLLADTANSRILILESQTFSVVDLENLPTPPQTLINWY